MGLVTLTSYQAGQVLTATALNNSFNAIVNQVNGSLDATNLANLAVTTAKIANASVTGAKIGMGSDAQGDILYYNGSAYARLGAGTSGQVLTTQGAAANPAWDWGGVIQRANVNSGAVGTGSTTTPNDDSIPQITEGNEILSLSFTPKSASSKLLFLISITVNESTNIGEAVAVALHKLGSADALAVGTADARSYAGTSAPLPTAFFHYLDSPGTSALTFSIRAGCDAGPVTWNGVNGNRKYGGVLISSLTILELK